MSDELDKLLAEQAKADAEKLDAETKRLARIQMEVAEQRHQEKQMAELGKLSDIEFRKVCDRFGGGF
jgi:hypothetical protein